MDELNNNQEISSVSQASQPDQVQSWDDEDSDINQNMDDMDGEGDDTIHNIAVALQVGDLAEARQLSDELWGKGGDLSSDDAFFYLDCLVNMGDVERAGLLLKPILPEMSRYIDEYWDIFLKYSFLSANMSLATSISEYPQVREQGVDIYNWLQQQKQYGLSQYYEQILRIAFNAVHQKLCLFDLIVTEDGSVSVNFYSACSDEENDQIAQKVIVAIDDYFERIGIEMPEGLYLAFDNVSNYPNQSAGSDD